MPAAKFQIKRKCKICGETFIAKTIESWYCSPKCSQRAYKRRKDEEARQKKLDEIADKIPESRDYIKVSEAYLTSADTRCIGLSAKELSLMSMQVRR